MLWCGLAPLEVGGVRTKGALQVTSAEYEELRGKRAPDPTRTRVVTRVVDDNELRSRPCYGPRHPGLRFPPWRAPAHDLLRSVLPSS